MQPQTDWSFSLQGFYSVSGSSLSDSCYSVSSDATHGGPLPPARPPKLWEQGPVSADNTDTLWSEEAVQLPETNSQDEAEPTEEPEPGSGETIGTCVAVSSMFLGNLFFYVPAEVCMNNKNMLGYSILQFVSISDK